MMSLGTPALVSASANRSAVKGVCGDGLSSTALPAMMAGRTELIETRYGKLALRKVSEINRMATRETHFQGAITRTTPRGTRLMYLRKPGLSVSCKLTSARLELAMSSIYFDLSRKPLISPAP